MTKKHNDFKRYIWQHSDWPLFTYDLSGTQDLTYQYLIEAGLLAGGLEHLPDDVQNETLLDIMVDEALKSSKIEGEKIDHEDVRSSIRKELGIPTTHVVQDARAIGIAKLMVHVKNTIRKPLTKNDLFSWHSMLMSAPHLNNNLINIGTWRNDTEPMQIVSGPMGREVVHFEAPPSKEVPKEMENFIKWFNDSRQSDIPGLVRAAIAHLYFECIHPFDDGNGRIGRAISEKALSQELDRHVLFSLSAVIEPNKKEYYKELSLASHCNVDITAWVNYFIKTIVKAQLDSKRKIKFILDKSKFWKEFEQRLNKRQEVVISRMFEAGESGFVGGMSASKYVTIAKCSKATATRDLSDLLELGCLKKLPGAGRSTRYDLNIFQS